MKEFWVKIVSLAAVVITLFGYNMILEAREKDEQIALLSVQLTGMQKEASKEADGETAGGKYKDGTYTGEADGFGGKISVEVSIEGHRITEVDILSAEKEDGAYLTMAKDIIPRIIEAQSAEVDTVSSATFSSSGIRNAAAQALEKAVE